MELITVAEAAERSGVGREAIYRRIRNGLLIPHRQHGRLLLDSKELAAYKPRQPGRQQRTVRSYGMLAGLGLDLSVDSFLKQKHADKALER